MRYSAVAIMFVATSVSAEDRPLTVPPPDYSGSYFCKATAAAGLRYDPTSKTWISVTFDVSSSGYTVKVADIKRIQTNSLGWKSRSYNVWVKDFGDKGDPLICFGRGDVIDEITTYSDRLECHMIAKRFSFDLKQNKYMINFEGGYFNETSSENTDTPYIEAGRCDKID